MQAELGHIVQNGTAIAGQTSVTFNGLSVPSNEHWGGIFTLAEGETIDLKGSCRLEMADGRSGEVVLYRKDAGSDRSTIVLFRGVGLLSSPRISPIRR